MDWRFNLKVISKEYDNIRTAVPDGTSKVKALFIKGEKSEYITDTDVSDIGKRFPNFSLKTIAGAGHWVHAEKPDEFVKEVLEFIKA